MSKRKDLIKILQICEKYDPGAWCCAEHDIIYVLQEGEMEKVSPEDMREMQELGAHIDEDTGGLAVFT